MISSTVSLLKISDYNIDNLKKTIEHSLNSIISLHTFKNKRVLLKINLNKGGPPDKALNTHPEFIRAVIQIIKKYGGIPFIGDSSALLGFTKEAFDTAGITQVTHEEDVALINFDSERYICKNIHGSVLKHIFIPEILNTIDIFISLPKLKTHDLLDFSGAVKNQMGLIPGAQKCYIHTIAPSPFLLAHALIDIHCAIPFDLAICDGIIGLESGDRPKKAGFIAASTDLVSLDSVCAQLIGINPLSVLTTKIGHERTCGNADLEKIKIVGDSLSHFQCIFNRKKYELKRIPWIAQLLYSIRMNILQLSIDSGRCTQCEICSKQCPVNAVNSNTQSIDKKACIKCFSCYHNCSSGAIELSCPWYFRYVFQKKAGSISLDKIKKKGKSK